MGVEVPPPLPNCFYHFCMAELLKICFSYQKIIINIFGSDFITNDDACQRHLDIIQTWLLMSPYYENYIFSNLTELLKPCIFHVKNLGLKKSKFHSLGRILSRTKATATHEWRWNSHLVAYSKKLNFLSHFR